MKQIVSFEQAKNLWKTHGITIKGKEYYNHMGQIACTTDLYAFYAPTIGELIEYVCSYYHLTWQELFERHAEEWTGIESELIDTLYELCLKINEANKEE